MFNPELGDEATEGEKILYFSPSTCSVDQQKTYVGLVEGLVNFSKCVIDEPFWSHVEGVNSMCLLEENRRRPRRLLEVCAR